MPSKAILLSIRPKYAEKVFDGTKRVELRRVRPNLSIGDLVVVYVSSPVKQIWGSFEVEQIVEKPLDELWNLVQNDAGVSRIEFDNYYNGLECGFGIYIKNFVSETTPISLNELREKRSNFHPPQSYRYLSTSDIQDFISLTQ